VGPDALELALLGAAGLHLADRRQPLRGSRGELAELRLRPAAARLTPAQPGHQQRRERQRDQRQRGEPGGDAYRHGRQSVAASPSRRSASGAASTAS